MKPILECRKLSFAYRPEVPVLEEVSLELYPGDFIGLIGPNGAGKSTILGLLSGYLRPDAGEIYLDGRPLAAFRSRERARKMALLPQSVYAMLPFTVRQLAALGRTSRLSRWCAASRHDRAVVEEVLELLGLRELAETTLSRLSGGERQRALLAAALAQEPEVLLLDEPTSALDLGHAAQFMRLIARLNRERGLSVLVISHDLELAARYADRLILLRGGKILAAGEPGRILTPELIFDAYGSRVAVVSGVHGEPLLSHLER